MPRPTRAEVEEGLKGLTTAQQHVYLDELDRLFPTVEPPSKPIAELTPEEARARLESVLRPGGVPGSQGHQPYMGPQTKNLPEAATHLALVAPIALTGGSGAAAITAARRLALSTAGSVIGAAAGGKAGRFLGEPFGLGKEGEATGEFVGGFVGGARGPQTLGSFRKGGPVRALLQRLLGSADESTPVTPAATKMLIEIAEEQTGKRLNWLQRMALMYDLNIPGVVIGTVVGGKAAGRTLKEEEEARRRGE